jgi:hypothetical protein
VLRNLVRTRARNDARWRNRAELAGAIGEPTLPSPEQLLTDCETQRLLADEVARLGEPFRSTVLLCYAEGIAPVEIARRSGVPGGTVRWHLKRGLDQLRARLEARHGRGWRAMLAPLAGKVAVPAAIGSTAIKVAVGCALLVAVASARSIHGHHLPATAAPPPPVPALTIQDPDPGNLDWCRSVVAPYDERLAGRYPFARGRGVRDARVADVEELLRPGTGRLWRYVASMAGDLEHPSGSTIFRPGVGSPHRPTPELLRFLGRSAELTQLLFQDPTRLSLRYSIRLRAGGYRRVTFESGAQRVIALPSTPQWTPLVWPARGAVLTVVDEDSVATFGHLDVEWGLFHLLDDARIERVSEPGEQPHLKAAWPAVPDRPPVEADLAPAALLGAFRPLDIPRVAVIGRVPCPQ